MVNANNWFLILAFLAVPSVWTRSILLSVAPTQDSWLLLVESPKLQMGHQYWRCTLGRMQTYDPSCSARFSAWKLTPSGSHFVQFKVEGFSFWYSWCKERNVSPFSYTRIHSLTQWIKGIQRFRVKYRLLGSKAGKGRLLDLGRLFANDAKNV